MDFVNVKRWASGWGNALAGGSFALIVPFPANDDRLGPPPTLPVAIARVRQPVRSSALA